jgi:hypothetical protein
MANPIKETPILYGNDARRFAERIANPKMVSPQNVAQMNKAYEIFQQSLDRGRKSGVRYD